MSWSVEKSARLYGVDSWGAGYFRINDNGNVEVAPGEDKKGLDLHKLVGDLRERGIRLPLLLRFPHIIQSRVELLNNCFKNAIKEDEYNGSYSGVYPIKVNQQRHLVEEIIEFGKDNQLGLECGSKPELLIALAMMDTPNAYIICNGFKDQEYIETALLSQKLGKNTFIVIDRFEELDLVIRSAKKLGIEPRLGFRVKLHAQGSGKWMESCGAHSKFGLTPSEIVRGVNALEEADMIKCLELVHFHIGSQIPSIQSIKTSIKEACRFYTELTKLGAPLGFIDVGGGLGVDYDGSEESDSSCNYSEQEYANDVVSILKSICDEKDVAHPHIISESGRALVAHSSMLVFDVLGVNQVRKTDLDIKPSKSDSPIVKDLFEIFETVNDENINEYYNDLIDKRKDTLNLFSYGALSLEQRAKAEDLYWAISTKMSKVAKHTDDKEDMYWDLQKELSDTYFCNFSVFQSLPDSWAMNQVFPVMPLQKLGDKPKHRATLADLTCDSDGKISKFIDTETYELQDFIEIHEFDKSQDYFMGVFMTGAYQEILGDLHNLFGDTDAVHITVDENGDYSVDHVVHGDSVADLLSYLSYHRPELVERIRKASESSISKGSLTRGESRLLLKYYEEGLSGYTYLEDDE